MENRLRATSDERRATDFGLRATSDPPAGRAGERPACQAGRRATGFTLVEIAVVIAIMGIMAIVMLPAVNVSQRDLDVVAKSLRSNLQLAQELAMTSGTTYGFRSLNTTSYEIYAGAPGNPAYNPLTNANFIVNINPAEFSGVVPAVPFLKTGAPNMAADATITLTSGGNTRTITVRQNTGFVTMQ